LDPLITVKRAFRKVRIHKNVIDIKFGPLFPWPFQFLAGILLIIGLAILLEKTILSIIMILGSGFVLSGYSGTEIDKTEKAYREYNAFLFIKIGKKIKYIGIEKIFINTSKVKQQLYTAHTSHSSVFTNTEFNGYVKFEDGTKIQLLSNPKKEKLVSELQKIAEFLNVQVEDNISVS
jgi:hypothetical protein